MTASTPTTSTSLSDATTLFGTAFLDLSSCAIISILIVANRCLGLLVHVVALYLTFCIDVEDVIKWQESLTRNPILVALFRTNKEQRYTKAFVAHLRRITGNGLLFFALTILNIFFGVVVYANILLRSTTAGLGGVGDLLVGGFTSSDAVTENLLLLERIFFGCSNIAVFLLYHLLLARRDVTRIGTPGIFQHKLIILPWLGELVLVGYPQLVGTNTLWEHVKLCFAFGACYLAYYAFGMICVMRQNLYFIMPLVPSESAIDLHIPATEKIPETNGELYQLMVKTGFPEIDYEKAQVILFRYFGKDRQISPEKAGVDPRAKLGKPPTVRVERNLVMSGVIATAILLVVVPIMATCVYGIVWGREALMR
ncbi:unnamed protein product [Amoebophrya sp. A25]|nr:unnamed protein product [Amoebophrya sp. A25]|eukprot:GSA25T00018018001.1